MRLEDMSVVLRPRQPWEAVDLGCAMVRRDFGRIIVLWCGTVLPLWVVLCSLMRSCPEWIPLVVWWLKPLYDRVTLFFLSRAAFGVRPGFREVWKEGPRRWLGGLVPALLWRRLSFIRSFALPAQMLEGLYGKAVKQRVRTLATDGGGSGFTLSYAFSKIELVAWLGLLWGTYGLLPESARPDWEGLFAALDVQSVIPDAFLWWGALCYMAIVCLVEPFYVGAGFALYLNCRTRIEGWDVELAFRKLAARLTSTVALVIALLLMGGLQPNAHAAESSRDAAEVIQEVLKSPDFEIHKIKTKKWVPDELSLPDTPEKPNVEMLGTVGRMIFWLILGGLLGWLIFYVVRNRRTLFSRRARKVQGKAPQVVMGMNITRESLPTDIVTAARRAWAAGEHKQALSLLYRGSLSWLVARRRVPIIDSDTEEDCLARVFAAGEKAEAAYFRRLTGAWVQIAYAVMPISDAEMQNLCDQWPFAEKGGAA